VSQAASTKELRSFGLLVGGVFTLIGLWPLLIHGDRFRTWAVIVGGLLVWAGGLVPAILAPFHKVWMRIGHVLGWINTRILLGIVFYGLITPMGILFRLIGKDTVRQSFSAASPTYRVNRDRRSPAHMKNQF
jgi:hypothetical protein